MASIRKHWLHVRSVWTRETSWRLDARTSRRARCSLHCGATGVRPVGCHLHLNTNPSPNLNLNPNTNPNPNPNRGMATGVRQRVGSLRRASAAHDPCRHLECRPGVQTCSAFSAYSKHLRKRRGLVMRAAPFGTEATGRSGRLHNRTMPGPCMRCRAEADTQERTGQCNTRRHAHP